MGSDLLPTKRTAVQWADLPSELLSVISGGLQNPFDIIGFRSVCQSWRSSTSLPNKISAFFPVKLPCSSSPVSATAVYLLRPRRDPSKPVLVSVQEPEVGKLVLRHALTHEEIPGDMWSSDYVTETPIAQSYGYNLPCSRCNGVAGPTKLVITILLNQLRLLDCERISYISSGSDIVDLVKHKGRIHAVDSHGYLYVLDPTTLELTQLTRGARRSTSTEKYLVASDLDLYMVVRKRSVEPLECYRLVSDCTPQNKFEWGRVYDLAGRVLFIAANCTFSVRARDLPRRWRGNCIVIGDSSLYTWTRCTSSSCRRGDEQGIQVFELGGGCDRFGFGPRPITSFPGYSDLFGLPSSTGI